MRTILALLCLAGAALAQNTPSLVLMSATLDSAPIAADSLVTAFATDPHMTDHAERAGNLPFPTSLAGISVHVTDSAGTQRDAGILYASPGQVNFLMPAGTATGPATVSISPRGNMMMMLQATTNVMRIAPALFTINGDGDDPNLAAAVAIRVVISTGAQGVVPVFQCDPDGGCVATPLDLGVDTPMYLELYGTGIRGRSGLDGVTATVAGQRVPVLYAGAQPQFPGLDQVNIALPLNLRGAGMANVVITVDGQPTNPVRINIQ